jgi:type VI secretion system protein VasG
MNMNLKALIARLDDACRDASERAAALCLARTNYEVDVEHYLLKLTEESERTETARRPRFRRTRSTLTVKSSRAGTSASPPAAAEVTAQL